ncbi:abnormal spindle-like microcephaly-associated protein [Megalops cyprinoides]|uniref:abnormal spindle-like microcephaly-associated protein n=1 Tax=Megalops cyprinoides TaxID=118141 RepID=UPI001864C81C|nr:abnormal spindle-like microcephaly-associated protein [Megalops cyprinoides]
MTSLVKKGDFLDFSPTNLPSRDFSRNDTNKENNKSLAVLSLVQFSRPPFVSFGTVRLGSSKSAVLCIENPVDVATEVKVDRVASTKGFSVEQTRFIIEPEESTCMTITWTPVEEGNVREVITFIANGIAKHQAILLGRAEAPKKKKKSLWDSIKNKKPVERSAPFKDKKTDSSVKKAANKTFHVSRQPQYKKERVRSPLRSQNENPVVESPVVLLVPAGKLFDSGESVKGNGCTDLNSVGPDEVIEPKTPSEISFELEAVKPRLTFFVKPSQVNTCESEAKDEVLKSSKIPFTSTTVTKSKGGSTQESNSKGRKTRTSKRRLLEKTLELSDSPARSSLPGLNDVGCLPVIDSDASLGTHPESVHSPLVVMPSNLSPVRFALKDNCPVSIPPTMAQLDLSPVVATPSCLPQTLVQLDFTVVTSRHQSKVSSLMLQPDESLDGKTQCRLAVNAHSQSILQSLKSFGSSSVKTAKVVAVAQSQLTFIKPGQTVIPRHPLPFAAKNMFYDERWIEKQERGFTWWINYVLTPDDFKVNTEVTKVNAVSLAMGSDQKMSIPKAPTKEEMSFRMYTARRRLNCLRRAACQLFTSEAMVKAIQRLELEVEAKRLLVRKDRHLWKDIGERQKVLNWLLSYNPLWLRIGLETIFGELIPLESNGDVMGLAMFILGRLLWNPDIAAEFRHHKVPHLYRDGHEEALSRFTLKKLLLLVCFLDKAKESRMIEHDPCLFCMDAEFKTSKDLLLAFSRDFLSGEGILSRHLGHLGFSVSHAQTPLDEFNFAVKNLAVDLKCGIRLVRIMELSTQDWSLSRKLRMPAISRLQKVHNVEIAMEVLKAKGVDLKDERGSAIDARDIVDGHREKTLSLLWKIIFTFQVEVLLDEEQLKEEISFLKRTWRTKQKMAALRANQDVAVKPVQRPSFEHSSTKITLLMDWVNAVCAFYSSKAENFTVSFSDGQILCHLIHHYHPCHLPLEAVRQNTTQTVECGQRGMVGLNTSSSDSDSSFDTLTGMRNGTEASVDFKELLENERSNFQLVNTAVSFLGGVPAMINPADMSNTIPNEKVVTCYLSFLCARLLDLRNETRAARVIQGAWRKYRLKRELKHFEERNQAAAKIQLAVRGFLQRRRQKRQNAAAVVIQAVWRGYSVRQQVQRIQKEKLQTLWDSAATVIQAQWRRYSTQRKFQCLKHHTVLMQARIRMKIAVTAYRRVQWAARTIQKHRKACLLGKEEHQKYQSLKYSTIKIQKCYRRWKTRTWIKKGNAATVVQRAFWKWQERKRAQQHFAAVKIQSWYRMRKCQKQYRNVQQKAICIQAWYRGCKERRNFQFLKLKHSSAIAIQRAFKTNILRRRFQEMKRAAVTIQRWFRSCKQREREKHQYLKMKQAAITLQAAFRGYSVRKFQKEQHLAAVVIQAAFRMFVARKRHLSLRAAAIAVQQRFKAKLLGKTLRKEYLNLRHSVVRLQALWRGRAERKRIEEMHKSAVLIQSCFRRYAAQSQFKLKRRAALVLQRYYRNYSSGRKVRLQYTRIKKAVLTLQGGFRGMKVRQHLRRQHRAATLIQAAYRASVCRRRFLSLKSAAAVLQQHYRAHLLGQSQRQHYSLLRQAAIMLQSAYRGSKERKNLRRMQQAATVIQARFRRHKAQVTYRAARCAASTIQQHYRAYVKGKLTRERYLQMRKSAVVIQSAYRGMKARLEVQIMHRAATVIQAHFRRHRAQVTYRAARCAASTIQQHYRAYVKGKLTRERYLQMRKSAVVIQSAYRGMKARLEVQIMHRAATVIQAHFRRHRAQVTYRAARCAASTIQQHYRAYVKGKLTRERYLQMRKSAVVIQSAYRGMKARLEVQIMHRAATVIQAHFRRHRAQVTYHAARCAASTIQQHYRAYVKGKLTRERYLQMRKSAVVIQSAYRGMKARLEVQIMHRAATVIQAHYRKHVQLSKFQKLCWAASVVHQRFRANQKRNAEVCKYIAMKKAAVCIQSAYRGMRTRNQLRKMQKAAAVIQRRYIAHREHKRYLAMKGAAVKIQQWYRALVIGRLQQKRYRSLLAAAIAVQARFRGMKVRKEIQKKHQAATVIQAGFRMYRTRMPFKALRLAATILQRRYRSHLKGRRERERFLKLRQNAIVIQSVFRGNRARKETRRMHSAATVIQSHFRRHQCQMHYKKVKWAAMVVQQWYRACGVRDALVQEYRSKKTAAVVIQSAFRSYKARQQVSKMHEAATVIQRKFKTFRERKCFLSRRAGAVLIQRRYRALVAMRRQHKEYLVKRNASIAIQAAYRGMKVRQQLQREHKAAIIIQAQVRKLLVRSSYKRLQWATKVVQLRYRANKMMKAEVQSLKEKKRAVITLQAAFHGMKTRQHIRQMHKAASDIQRCFRAHRARKQYISLKSCVVAIQRRYRSITDVRRQKEQYRLLRSATVTLQAAYRGHRTRKEIRQKHAAATVLQTAFRRHREVVKFQAMRFSALVIQRQYRAYIQTKHDREKFLRLRTAAITIQAAVRGKRVRQNIAQMHKAAIVIQTSFRMCRQRASFKRLRWAASLLQQKFRASRLRDSHVMTFQQLRKAAVCIQASFRGRQARQLVKQIRAARKIQSYLRMSVQRRQFLQQKAASVVIQSAFRCHLARTRYTKMRSSSVVIQRWYKSCRAAHKQKAEYHALRHATVTLQSAFRGMLARRLAKWKRAAVKIQSVLQMVRHRKKFLSLRSSTIKLQAHCRMWVARRRFVKYQTAALTLQKHFRARQAMREQRSIYLKTLKSVQILQSRVRGHNEYRKFQKLKRSAVTIQAFYRGMVERRKFQHQKASIARIQEYYRSYLLCKKEREKYLKIKKSAILIQAAFRGLQARQHIKEIRAALKIQAWFRGHMTRKRFLMKQNAVATVHRCMQTRIHRNRFLKIRQSVCIIQRRWRETHAAREYRHDFLKMRASAVKIQALWRGHTVRLNLQKEQKAACMIQSFYRGYVQRRAFQRLRTAALVLQKRVRVLQRGREQRETFKNMKTAAIVIQAFCRGWLVRRWLKEEAQSRRRQRFSAAVYHNLCAVKIQRALRAHWALKSAKKQLHSVIYIQRWIRAKLEKRRYLEKRGKVIKLQRSVRRWLSRRNTAATVIQHAAKKYLAKRREQRVQRGITKAQALWRGHCSRKINDTRKVVAMRHRFRKVNQEAKEEDKLCNKTTTAIDYLLRYKHFSYILAALKHLETATRLSSKCCEQLVKSGATLVIFTLIRSCNRSVPCMEVITFAIQVLLNLSKYDKTTEAVYAVENSVDTLLDLLQIYREKAGDKVADKGGSIFTKTCFLLAILLQDEQRASEVKRLPKAMDRIRSIYHLTLRKHKMDAERTVTRQKLNVSLNGSFFTQATPRKPKPKPRFAPDWVLRQDKMKEVLDPLRAIQMVADAFTIIP